MDCTRYFGLVCVPTAEQVPDTRSRPCTEEGKNRTGTAGSTRKEKRLEMQRGGVAGLIQTEFEPPGELDSGDFAEGGILDGAKEFDAAGF